MTSALLKGVTLVKSASNGVHVIMLPAAIGVGLHHIHNSPRRIGRRRRTDVMGNEVAGLMGNNINRVVPEDNGVAKPAIHGKADAR